MTTQKRLQHCFLSATKSFMRTQKLEDIALEVNMKLNLFHDKSL